MDKVIKLVYCAKLSTKFKPEWRWVDGNMTLLMHTDIIYATRKEMELFAESIKVKKWKWTE